VNKENRLAVRVAAFGVAEPPTVGQLENVVIA
jgi:hypothetical protein